MDATMPDLLSLNDREFENLIFDLVCELGLKNCVWRTPGADVGRDIQGEYYFSDVSSYFQKQTWYVECKRYTSSVSWPTVWEKISYAETHNADVLLIATTSSLSPQALDQINTWNEKRKSPIIRALSGVDILSRLRSYPHLLVRHGLSDTLEKDTAISLLPLVRLLLSVNYSISGGLATGSDVARKVDLAQAITDLLSVRLINLDPHDHLIFYPFKETEDTYDWLINGISAESSGLDRYALRAVFCFLRFCTRSTALRLEITIDDRLCLDATIDDGPDEPWSAHLRSIATWSDFHAFFQGEKVILERR